MLLSLIGLFTVVFVKEEQRVNEWPEQLALPAALLLHAVRHGRCR